MATLGQAKRDFELGALKACSIHRAPFLPGWFLTLMYNGVPVHLVDARGKTPRVFKTLDAAVAAAEQIGFKVEGLTVLNGRV